MSRKHLYTLLTLVIALTALRLLAPLPSEAAVTGNITALNGTVRIGLPPATQTVAVQISGTFVATLLSEATIDGSTWFQLPMFTVLTGLKADTTAAAGNWVIPVAAYGSFRIRASAFVSGTVTVHLEASTGAQGSHVFTGVSASVTDTNLLQIGGTVQSGANVIDTVNSAIKVNVVAGGAGGGNAQLQVRNSGDTAWVNVGIGAESASVLKVPVRIHDASGNIVAVLNAAPAGTEYALVVRNIPSGTQTVSGTVTANQGGTWTVQPGNTQNTTPWLVRTSGEDLTENSPAAASVGITSGQILASNANRKGLALVNTSNNRISLAFGAAAVLDSGITLLPGGTFVMDAYTFSTAAVNAIASAASSNIAIQEYQ